MNKMLLKMRKVIEQTGLSRQVIQHYAMLGLIREAKRTPAGHRLFDPAVIDRLLHIEALKKDKSLAQIRDLLEREV